MTTLPGYPCSSRPAVFFIYSPAPWIRRSWGAHTLSLLVYIVNVSCDYSIHTYVRTYIHIYIYMLFIYLFIYVFIYLFIYFLSLCIDWFMYLFICLCICVHRVILFIGVFFTFEAFQLHNSISCSEHVCVMCRYNYLHVWYVCVSNLCQRVVSTMQHKITNEICVGHAIRCFTVARHEGLLDIFSFLILFRNAVSILCTFSLERWTAALISGLFT